MKSLKPIYKIPYILKTQANLITEYDLIGGRFSGKTMGIEEVLLATLCLNETIDILCVRYWKQDIEEMWKNILYCIERCKFPVKISKKYLITYGKNSLQVKGVFTQDRQRIKLIGLANKPTLYKIIWFEEMFEFDEKTYLDVIQSVRNCKWIVVLKSCNPWLESNWYIKSVLDLIDKRELTRKLKNHTYYEKLIDNERLVIWNNVYDNPYLDPERLKKLEKLEHTNPQRAKVELWGLPGVLEHSIFGNYLNKIGRKPVVNRDNKKFLCGLDYGSKEALMTCVFGFLDEWNNLIVFKEYSHDNKEVFKDLRMIANEIVAFIIQQKEIFPRLKDGLDVKCDYAEDSFITMLNESVPYKESWLNFCECEKPPVAKRVGKMISLLSKQKVYILEGCEGLFNDLSNMCWKKNSYGKYPEIEDKNTFHFWDAFCYGFIIPNWWWIGSDELDFISATKKGTIWA